MLACLRALKGGNLPVDGYGTGGSEAYPELFGSLCEGEGGASTTVHSSPLGVRRLACPSKSRSHSPADELTFFNRKRMKLFLKLRVKLERGSMF